MLYGDVFCGILADKSLKLRTQNIYKFAIYKNVLFAVLSKKVRGPKDRHRMRPSAVHKRIADRQRKGIINGFSSPSSADQLQKRMSACIDDVANWMSSNRLQLNASKTEIMWCTSHWRQSQLPTSVF